MNSLPEGKYLQKKISDFRIKCKNNDLYFLDPTQESLIDHILKEKRKKNPDINAKDIDPEEIMSYME